MIQPLLRKITITQSVLAFVLVTVFQTPGNTQETPPAGDSAASPPAENSTEPRASIDTYKQSLTLLQEELESDELNWLEANGEKFMALWQPDKTGNPYGAVIILHGEGQSADWPNTVNAIRNNLSLHGWGTLAISLPEVPKHSIPPRPEPTPQQPAGDSSQQSEAPAQDSSQASMDAKATDTKPEMITDARMAAAVDFLKQAGQYNIVIVGHGVGAVRAARFINQISAAGGSQQMKPRKRGKINRPIRALVLVSARNRIDTSGDQLFTFLNDPELPILDIYYGDHFLDRIEVKARYKKSRELNIRYYYQIKVIRPTNTDTSSENRLTRRIRGFLNKHAKGVEIEMQR